MYHIIVNSTRVKGRRKKHLDTVKAVFDRAGREYKIYMTEHAGHAKEIAERITSSGERCTLIAMGGDGTLHEVLNGIKYPERCALGLIPAGTGNDFAACIPVPKDVKHAAQIIAFKAPVPIDYIQLSCGIRSINAVGMGLDCDVLQRAYKGRLKGKLKYLYACVVSLFKFKSYKFTADIDGEVTEHYGMLTCIGNGRQIGGGIKLFPEASPADGWLNVVMADFISKRRAVREFINLMRGKLQASEKITITRAKKVCITREKGYVIQAEGELYPDAPLNCEIVSGKLSFYMP